MSFNQQKKILLTIFYRHHTKNVRKMCVKECERKIPFLYVCTQCGSVNNSSYRLPVRMYKNPLYHSVDIFSREFFIVVVVMHTHSSTHLYDIPITFWYLFIHQNPSSLLHIFSIIRSCVCVCVSVMKK